MSSSESSGTTMQSHGKFDIHKTLVIIHSWPKRHASTELMGFFWGLGFDINQIKTPNWRTGLYTAYNRAITKIVLAPRFKHYDQFIICDNDLEPTKTTKHFLELETDVRGCRYTTAHDGDWGDPDTFHCGMYWTHRKVWEAFAWDEKFFEPKVSPQGDETLRCCCMTFADKCRAKGFTVAHSGFANHDV